MKKPGRNPEGIPGTRNELSAEEKIYKEEHRAERPEYRSHLKKLTERPSLLHYSKARFQFLKKSHISRDLLVLVSLQVWEGVLRSRHLLEFLRSDDATNVLVIQIGLITTSFEV